MDSETIIEDFIFVEDFGWILNNKTVLSTRIEVKAEEFFLNVENLFENKELRNSFLFKCGLVFLGLSIVVVAPQAGVACTMLRKNPKFTETTLVEFVEPIKEVVKKTRTLSGVRRRLGRGDNAFNEELMLKIFKEEVLRVDLFKTTVLKKLGTEVTFDFLSTSQHLRPGNSFYCNNLYKVTGGFTPPWSPIAAVDQIVRILNFFSPKRSRKDIQKEKLDLFSSNFANSSNGANGANGLTFLPAIITICFFLFKKEKMKRIFSRVLENVGLAEKETLYSRRSKRLMRLFDVSKPYIYVILSGVTIIVIFRNKDHLFKTIINPVNLAFDFMGKMLGEYNFLVGTILGNANRVNESATERLNKYADDNARLVVSLQAEKLALEAEKMNLTIISSEELGMRKLADFHMMNCEKQLAGTSYELKVTKERLRKLDGTGIVVPLAKERENFFGGLVKRLQGPNTGDEKIGNEKMGNEINLVHIDMNDF